MSLKGDVPRVCIAKVFGERPKKSDTEVRSVPSAGLHAVQRDDDLAISLRSVLRVT